MGAIAIDDVIGISLADGGYTDEQTRDAGTGIAPHQVYAIFLTRQTDAGIEFLDVLEGKAFTDAQTHGYLLWRTVHGIDVAQVDHHSLVTQMLQRHIAQVEVYALKQQVGGD